MIIGRRTCPAQSRLRLRRPLAGGQAAPCALVGSPGDALPDGTDPLPRRALRAPAPVRRDGRGRCLSLSCGHRLGAVATSPCTAAAAWAIMSTSITSRTLCLRRGLRRQPEGLPMHGGPRLSEPHLSSDGRANPDQPARLGRRRCLHRTGRHPRRGGRRRRPGRRHPLGSGRDRRRRQPGPDPRHADRALPGAATEPLLRTVSLPARDLATTSVGFGTSRLHHLATSAERQRVLAAAWRRASVISTPHRSMGTALPSASSRPS